MAKTIEITTCKDCPYLRYPWSSAIGKRWACGNSFVGSERSREEKDWLGGDALPGDQIIKNIDIIQPWCKLNKIGE